MSLLVLWGCWCDSIECKREETVQEKQRQDYLLEVQNNKSPLEICMDKCNEWSIMDWTRNQCYKDVCSLYLTNQ